MKYPAKNPAKFLKPEPEPDIEAGYPARSGFSRISGRFLMYSHHKEQKKRAYNVRILEVERGVFTPLVLSTSGGMGEEDKTLLKRVAAKMANKTGQKYSETITFIRKRLRF